MKAFLILPLVVAAFLTTSCNTVIGVGRDMRIAGEGMEKIANKASGGASHEDTSGAPVY